MEQDLHKDYSQSTAMEILMEADLLVSETSGSKDGEKTSRDKRVAVEPDKQLVQSFADKQALDLRNAGAVEPIQVQPGVTSLEVIAEDSMVSLPSAVNVEVDYSLVSAVEITATNVTHNANGSYVSYNAADREDRDSMHGTEDDRVGSDPKVDIDVICGKCGKHFNDIQKLSSHLKLHCKIQEKFASPNSDRNQEHNFICTTNSASIFGRERTKYSCFKCGKTLSSVNTHSNACDGGCCGGSSALQQSLVVSIVKVDIESLTCPVCLKIFCDSETMWRHYGGVHFNTFNAIEEKDEVSYKKNVISILALHSEGSCPVCQSHFSESGSLWRHVRTMHPTEFEIMANRKEDALTSLENIDIRPNCDAMLVKKYSNTCSECGRSYLRAGYLRRHKRQFHSWLVQPDEMEVHLGVEEQMSGSQDVNEAYGNSFTCTKCQDTFSELDYLKSHALVEHNDTDPGYEIQAKSKEDSARTCKQCGMLLSNSSIMREHYTVAHLKEKPLQIVPGDNSDVLPDILNSTVIVEITSTDENRSHLCDWCGESFAEFVDLQHHTATCHAKFSCLKCYKVCHSNYELKEHMRIHTREKPYSCKECGKVFATYRNMKKHKFTHTGLRPFQCDLCSKTFTQKHNLKLHMLVHTGGGKYPCSDCGKRCVGPAALARHRRTHTGEQPYTCETCEKSFKHSSGLKKHNLVHTGEKPWACATCNACFSTNGALKAHQLVHTKERPYACLKCGKKFSSTSILNRHLKTHTGEKPFVCEYCSQRFAENSKLVIHRRTHTGETPFHCTECGASFISKRKLHRHMGFHNPQYSCKECGKSYIDSFALKIHMFTHTGERPHQCNICPKTFRTAGSLRTHLMSHAGIKPFICDVCGKGFTSSLALSNHKTLHTGDRPFQCDQCAKNFPSLLTLNTHKQFHQKEKQHECCQCGRKFHRIYELQKHSRVHSHERPYSCDHCSKTFRHASTLRDHINTHTHQNWYSCECGKTFLRYHTLQKHRKTHLKEKPHTCPECDKKFTRKENLKKHLMTYHNMLMVTTISEAGSDVYENSDGHSLQIEFHEEGDDVAIKVADKIDVMEQITDPVQG